MHNPYRPVVPEFILIVSAKRYYIGTSYMPTGPSKYHQNDHVAELVADVSLNERAVRSFSLSLYFLPQWFLFIKFASEKHSTL